MHLLAYYYTVICDMHIVLAYESWHKVSSAPCQESSSGLRKDKSRPGKKIGGGGVMGVGPLGNR